MQMVAFRAATTGGSGDTTPPTAPSNLITSVLSSSQISLSWTCATDNVGVSAYQIERCQGAGCSNFIGVTTVAGTTYTNSGLSPSTSYTYRVRATDAAGNLGPYSTTATAATLSAPDTSPPTTPGGVTSSAVSTSQINVSWTASTDDVGVTGYQIERCQGSGCSNFSFRRAPVTGTTFNNTGLTASTSYSYRLRATDAAGNLSPYSVTTRQQHSNRGHGTPSSPTNLTTSVISGSQINLSWTASTDNVGVAGYQIERCQNAGCSNFALLTTVAAASATLDLARRRATAIEYVRVMRPATSAATPPRSRQRPRRVHRLPRLVIAKAHTLYPRVRNRR